MISYSYLRIVYFLLILLYIIMSCLSFYSGELLYRLFAVSVGLIVFISILTRVKVIYSFGLLIPLVIVLLIGIYNYQWSEFRSIFLVFVFLSCFGISWAAFEFNLTKFAYEYVFMFFLGLTSVLFFVFGYGPNEFNKFLEGSSRNVYSALLIASCIGYLISIHYRHKRPSFLLLSFFVILSFPLYGRTGIFLSLVIFCIALLVYRPVPIFVMVAVLLPVSLLFYSYVFFDYVQVLDNTSFVSGLDSSRYQKWYEYISNLEMSSIVFGLDFTQLPIIHSYGDNPHNAFIRLHGYWGLGVFIILFIVSISTVYHVLHSNYFFLGIAAVVLFRSFFDIVYFFNLFDYLFFPVLFYFFYICFFHVKKRSY